MHFGWTDERGHLFEIWNRVRHKKEFRVVETHLQPGEAKALFGNAELTFGISYHSGVFSLSSGTPFLGLHRGAHYGQKMLGLSELYGLRELPVSVDATSPEVFGNLLLNTFRNRRLIASRLEEKQKHLVAGVVDFRKRFLAKVRRNMDHRPAGLAAL